MNIEFVPLNEARFEPVRQVLDIIAREKRYLAFTAAPGRDEAYAFYRDIVDKDQVFTVALCDAAVVGWCDVLPLHGQARAHVGTLGMGLLPGVRHRGIGLRLIRASLDKAQAKGFERIELTVFSDNANARALYERVGFVTEGLLRRAFRIDGCYYDAYTMALLTEKPQ